MNESNKFSFKGYSLKTWLKINKDGLKILIMGTSALLTALLISQPPEWKAFYTLLAGAGSKLILDTIDYFVSE